MSLQSDARGLIMQELPLVWKIINWFGDWALRFATLGSLVLTSVIIVSADTRRQYRSRLWMSILWAAYKYKQMVAEYAMTHLALSSTVTAQEQQLVSFWAPFLLLYLAGPDNITAFALEDGKLSLREVMEALWNIAQGIYVMIKYIYLCNSGVMRYAASIMLMISVLRYAEKVFAQLGGNIDNQWASKKKHKPAAGTGGECGDLLLKAHTQFRACGRRAMSDSSVVVKDSDDHHSIAQKIFDDLELWEVIGMELSLMYDVLYTKATVIHTWTGYLLRLVSPVCTAAALILFILSPKCCEETRDIVITYILLGTTLFLDVVWLLSALASTWAHDYLNVRANTNMRFLHRALLCGGWWRKLRRMVVKVKDPTGHRMWSGRVGRYKLLAECTRRPSTVERLCTCLVSKLSLDDIWNEFLHWRCISELKQEEKKFLFERLKQRLHDGNNPNSMKAVTIDWGQQAVRRKRSKATDKLKGIIKKLEPVFGREFQEDILLWHIGTTIFLAHSRGSEPLNLITDDGDGLTTVLAIEALSEYLMFLVAVRPRMLPGLELRKLFKVTRKALKKSWVNRGKQQVETKRVHCYESIKEKQLAQVLRNETMPRYKQESDVVDVNLRLIWAGNQLATELLKVKNKDDMKELLELMLDVWVDKMLYAATRCSKDSHAKQLGRGGELTTIVWIVAEHTGLFPIGENVPKPPNDDPPKEEKTDPHSPSPCEKNIGDSFPENWNDGTYCQCEINWNYGGCPNVSCQLCGLLLCYRVVE